jgi:glycosyltransferase involved in cell wall biosynthesis
MSNTLFVNGRFLDQPLTGVQRYARELMRHIDYLISTGQPFSGLSVVCLVSLLGKEPLQKEWKHIEMRRVGQNQNNIWEQLDLPLALKGQFLFSPTNLGPFLYRNQAATLHDASVFAMPQAYSPTFRMKYKLGIGLLSHNIRLAITVSKFSQKELGHFLNLPQERFQVIYHGSDHLDPIPDDESILDDYELRGQPYFLVVSSQSVHKNVSGLFEAVRKMDAMVRLVLVGGSFKSVFQGNNLGVMPPNIVKVGYIDDSKLKALYKNALGLIFPSLYEGFGLPVLEAMRCGCPVLCSRVASLPEVGGDAVLYFDPRDPEDMANVLNRFISDPGLQADLKKRGLARSEQFLWKDTAKKTLGLLVENIDLA